MYVSVSLLFYLRPAQSIIFAHAIFFCVCRKGEIPSTPLCVLYTTGLQTCSVTSLLHRHTGYVCESLAPYKLRAGIPGFPLFCTQNRANSLQRDFPGFDANSDITFSLIFVCFDGTMIAIAIIVEKITRCEWFVRNIKSIAFSAVRQKLELESDRNLFECF